MNMKLLDLQTCKYLERGRDFLYGGDRIHIFSDSKSELTNDKTPINEAIHIGFYADCSYIEACFLSEPPLPLKPICEKVGAVVYGGKYVLLMGFAVPKSNKYDKDNYFIGDVASVCVNAHGDANEYRLMILAKCESTLLEWYEVHKFKKQGYFCITSEIDTDYSDFFYNAFEEYSKQLRNEPNKFEELKEFIK